MRAEEFIERVQQQLGTHSREEAEQSTHAVLETLGERLPKAVKMRLASQLPNELSDDLNQRPQDRYDLQEFYRRVGARSGSKYFESAVRAKAVMAVLSQAVSPGEIQDILEPLPSEYRELFTSPTRGPGFPSIQQGGKI